MAVAEEAQPEGLPTSFGPRAAAIVLALVPGALTVLLGYRAGGFFVGATAGAATVLLLILAGRVLIAPLPGEGFNRRVALALAGLALFAVWTLVSSRWSQAPARALIEFDRALLYTLAFVLCAMVAMHPRRLRWMVGGIAIASVLVCGAGLITRLLPDVWPIVEASINTRLSYPVTYWNALGLLAAIGIIICFGLTSSEREPRVVRVLAAATIPMLASTLLLTLSRGSLAAAALGVVLFAAVGHPRALLSGAIAVVPATAIAISSTYGADALISSNPLSAAAQEQGQHVATVVAICSVSAALLRTLLLYVDEILSQLRPTAAVRRQVLQAGAVALTLAVVLGAVAIDAPGRYKAFVSSGTSQARSDAVAAREGRERLSMISDNGRVALWTVAVDEFERHPVHGTGAGTYEVSWNQHRPNGSKVVDAHSLYAEVSGELGSVGLLLLLTALVTIIVGVARRARGADRALFATILAAIVAWAVAAGFDWHWEMPVVTLWVFALGGAAIAARRRRAAPTRFLGMLPRAVIAIFCVGLAALVPMRLIISQDRLESTKVAFVQGRCNEVAVLAGEAANILSARPEPLELSAACAMREGRRREAIATLHRAVQRDPSSWRLHYSLAVAQARAGRDPRLEIGRARRLNPRDSDISRAAAAFDKARGGDEWRETARRLHLEILIPTI